MESATWDKASPRRMTPAAFPVASMPRDMATPTSAVTRAGASLMPSPTMATVKPWARSFSIWDALSPGNMPPRTTLSVPKPSSDATASTAACLSPDNMCTRTPAAFKR